jgi:hypothetical protein
MSEQPIWKSRSTPESKEFHKQSAYDSQIPFISVRIIGVPSDFLFLLRPAYRCVIPTTDAMKDPIVIPQYFVYLNKIGWYEQP